MATDRLPREVSRQDGAEPAHAGRTARERKPLDELDALRRRLAALEGAEARRARAEEAARAYRLYAESIIQTTREPLLVLDADLRVKAANPAFCRTFGVSPA